MSSIKVIVNKTEVTLTDKNYIAQGGQGTVYVKNNVVYKIYHDPSRLIPENKIEELQVLKDLDNVIIPSTSIIDPKTYKRIGFIMKYVDDTEFLCKLFVGNFKKENNISNQMIVDLVEQMQKTLTEIHKRGIIVGDYNEMNFLSDKTFRIPYHIDVDSYQTPSFKCNAIMESVRDPLLPFGTFNNLSDWFSWAIVSFQLYTGIHPYKGKHPKYKPNDITNRMKDNISVFDKSVSVPKFVNFSNIPKNHLDWYKNIFVKNERSIPPLPNGIMNIPVIKPVIDNTGNVLTNVLFDFYSDILDVIYKNGTYNILTKDGIYNNDKLVLKLNKIIDNGRIVFTPTNDLLVVFKDDNKIEIVDENNIHIQTINIDKSKFKIFNNCLYEINDAGVIQHSFEKIGKIKVIPRVVSSLNYNSSGIYNGVVIENIYGKYNAIIPYAYNSCVSVKVPELNNCRILDAKRLDKWLFVIHERQGVLSLSYYFFDNSFTKYQYKVEDGIDFRNINAIIKQNGMIVLNKEDDVLELFFDFQRGSKLIGNTPLQNDLMLIDGKNTCFVKENILYSIKMK